MNSKTIANGIIRALLIVTGILLFLFFLVKIQSVIVYLVIAAVITLILRPVLKVLNNKLKLPNTVSVVITMSLFVLIVFGLIGLFIPLIAKQGQNLSLLDTAQYKETIQKVIAEVNLFLSKRGINMLEELKNLDLISNFKHIPDIFNSIISGIGSFSIGLFSILFITFFLMKDNQILHNSLFALIPDKSSERIENSLSKIKDLLSRYFVGLVFQISILFIIYTTVLLIFGIENAVVIAFLCAFLNLIPYIGPMIGGLLMFVLTISEGLSSTAIDYSESSTTFYVMMGYLFAQLIDNFFSQPYIFSKSVKSHPLEIFLIIIIGGLLFGVTGMVIAVPTYTALKVILKEFLSDNKIVKSLTKDL